LDGASLSKKYGILAPSSKLKKEEVWDEYFKEAFFEIIFQVGKYF
jgi:hypothetical protein